MRTFRVDFSGTCILKLDDRVIEVVDDEWRDSLYNLTTPEAIAEHIAYNVVANHAELTQLDGWADLDNKMMMWAVDVEMENAEEEK